MASETIVQDVYDFLKQYPPFNLIDKDTLFKLATGVTIQYYEEGQRIFRQGEKPFSYFFVVNKGSINVIEHQEDGKEELLDKCDEGDIFGVRASIADDAYFADAVCAEESLLYTIPMDEFSEVMTMNPQVALFLAAGFASGVSILKSGDSQNIRDMRRFLAQDNPMTRELIETDTLEIQSKKEVISCTPHHTVREAAKIMSIFNVGSIIITDEKQRPLGIITDSDFRRKVVASEDIIKNKPVTEIMSSPVKTIKVGLSVAEVMLLMISHKISHFCVTEDGTDQTPIVGVVSQRDILIAQGNNPAVLTKQIKKTNKVSQLKSIREKAEYLIKSYLSQEVGIPFISNIITAINDILIQKAAEIAEQSLKEQGLEKPEIRYCWLALGSEGRKEQLLRTDQDNALIYDNPPEDKQEAVHEYFLKFSGIITDILVECGFVKCPAGMMASNPTWCKPISTWKTYFHQWISIPEPQALMKVSIFFDFRPIVGDFTLAHELKEFIFEEIDKNELFIIHLAKNAMQNPPPLSFFRSFIVEKSGDHKNEFDIKARAMMPLIDAARVLAYQLKLKNYGSTLERFEEIAKRDKSLAPICESAATAFEILLRQRAIHGLKNHSSGRYINPEALNKLERQTIRNTFKTIERIQQTLELRFRLGYLS
ncbi:MAG: DUF294 nucleotidyltransferase-like domain-containing protein [Microscillaceae bacterium]|nr:DUF294 nucleotidyltransferase-like domain-containing protein [Microscillaceae bacterium]